jgi:hypothetical protein
MAVSIRPYPHLTKLGCQIPESEVSDSPQRSCKPAEKSAQKVSEAKNDSPKLRDVEQTFFMFEAMR